MASQEGIKQSLFDDMKRNVVKIWKTYDNEYGYVDEKLGMAESVTNDHPDNYWAFIGMFDGHNQKKLFEAVSEDTKEFLVREWPEIFGDTVLKGMVDQLMEKEK